MTQLSTENGLLQNSVVAMVQTRDGFIWLGTLGGLARFDGIRFTTFNLANTPSLMGNRILSLLESQTGDLWIGFTSSGITRLRAGEFTAYHEEDGAPRGPVRSIFQDADGAIWFVGRDLVRFADGNFENVGPRIGLPPNVRPWWMHVADDSTVWLATSAGLGLLTNDTWQRLTIPNAIANRDTRFVGRIAGNGLWAAGQACLACHDQKTASWQEAEDSIGWIFAALNDRSGNYWLGSERGLFRFVSQPNDPPATCPRRVEPVFEPDYQNRVGQVRSLLEDREGTLWVGTDGNGLFRLRPREFDVLPLPQGIRGVTTRHLANDNAGGVWLGTYNRLIHYVDGQLSQDDATRSISRINCIEPARDGGLWIAHDGNQLSRMRDGEIISIDQDLGAIGCLTEDGNGNLWILSARGLSTLSAGTTQTMAFAKERWDPDLVSTLSISSRNGVWISRGSALTSYRADQTDPHPQIQLDLGADIRSFLETADGSIWYSTYGAGLVRLRNNQMARFTTARGLPDDSLGKILQDDDGNLWVNSNRGVFRVPLAELNARADDALPLENVRIVQTGESTGPHGIRAPDGRFWLPTLSDVAIIDPRKSMFTTTPPLPVIEHIAIDGAKLDPAARIVAPPGHGRLEVHFTAPAFVAPEQIRFRYLLDGFDQTWVEAGASREAVYTNLPAGSYQFRLRASNGVGPWVSDVATLDLEFQPRFYETGTFMALSILSIISLAWTAHHLRTRRMRRRSALLQQQRDELESLNIQLNASRAAADAATRAKSEFLANMSHEIRTPMTAILGYVDLLAMDVHQSPAPGKRLEYIDTIRRNSSHLLAIINDILDLSKIEAGRMTVERMNTRPVEVVREVVTLMSVSATSKGLRIDTVFEDPLPAQIQSDPNRLRQILLNLVGNSVKFTESGGVTIRTRYAQTNHELQFDVVDTGIGMTAEQKSKLFAAFAQGDSSTNRRYGGTGLGLRISQRLAGLLGGTITVDSVPHKGSTFTLSLATGPLPGVEMIRANQTNGHSKKVASVPVVEPAARPLDGKRILLVDDAMDNQQLVSFLLRSGGAVVRAVANGKLAVEAFTTDGSINGPLLENPPFDLVFMDMQMPCMDGYEATRMLRSKGCTLPIVALTAHAMDGEETKCRAAGCDSFVAKPVDRRTLYLVCTSFLNNAPKNGSH